MADQEDTPPAVAWILRAPTSRGGQVYLYRWGDQVRLVVMPRQARPETVFDITPQEAKVLGTALLGVAAHMDKEKKTHAHK